MGQAQAIDRLREAWRAHQAGQLEIAEREYRALLAEFPSHPDTLNRFGLLCTQSGRPELALDAFSRACAAAPEDAASHANLARVALALGQAGQAQRAATRALALGAGAAAWQLLANALKDLDQLEAAEAACRSGLERHPHDPGLRFNLAVCLVLGGRPELAESLYRELVRDYPERPRFQHGLGNALAALGRRGEAESAYRHALALGHAEPAVALDLGLLLLQSGRPAEALVQLRDLVSTQRPSPAAVAALGVAAWLAGEQALSARLLDWPRQLLRGVGPILDEAGRGELVAALLADPGLQPTPATKTTRGGAQTGRLGPASAAPIARFVEQLEAVVAARLDALQAALEALRHPLASTRPPRWQLHVWATVLGESGHQAPHLHPAGWASGVHYLALPDVDASDPSGAIEFGRPPAELDPWLEGPVLALTPLEGELLLFPSSSYHRTLPYRGRAPRISIAFDVLPLGA